MGSACPSGGNPNSLVTVVYLRGNDILSRSCRPMASFLRLRPSPSWRSSCMAMICLMSQASSSRSRATIPVMAGRTVLTDSSASRRHPAADILAG